MSVSASLPRFEGPTFDKFGDTRIVQTVLPTSEGDEHNLSALPSDMTSTEYGTATEYGDLTVSTIPSTMTTEAGLTTTICESVDDDEDVSIVNESIEHLPVPPVGFVVIGAGLPRTGTASLREALTVLLGGPVYHMYEVFVNETNLKFWDEALRRRVTPQMWADFFESRGYRAGIDNPCLLYYKELMRAFPNAKVILTVRSPSSWVESVYNTLVHSQDNIQWVFPVNVYNWLMGNATRRRIALESNQAIHEDMTISMYDAVRRSNFVGIQFYKDWVSQVKQNVPRDRLLVFNVREGWEPLCRFLGQPVPEDRPFPHVNDQTDRRSNEKRILIKAYIVVVGLPVCTSLLLFALRDKICKSVVTVIDYLRNN